MQLLFVNPEPPWFFMRFSSFDRLQRCVAWIRRFQLNASLKLKVKSQHLSLDELTWAKRAILGLAQRISFPVLLERLEKKLPIPSNHQLAKLHPHTDKDGLLRVRKRDGKADNIIGLNTLQPIILSNQQHITHLLAKQAHLLTSHGGPSAVMAYLASQWPIPACKGLVNRITSQCATCKKVYARAMKPPVAELPKQRVTPAPPFTVTGIDYAGPFQYKSSDDDDEQQMQPCYVCLFICFSTKAVHLELAHNLTAAEFVAALQRFTDRQNLPNEIYSDNGSSVRA